MVREPRYGKVQEVCGEKNWNSGWMFVGSGVEISFGAHGQRIMIYIVVSEAAAFVDSGLIFDIL